MRRYSFTFFCIILSIGNLETVSNEENIWRSSNFVDAGLRSMPTRSCLKHSHAQEVHLEQPVLSSASRRSYSHKSESNSLVNFKPVPQPVSRYEISRIGETYNEVPLHPQLINNGDSFPENQDPLDETSSTPSEILVENNIIEQAQPIIETTHIVYETTQPDYETTQPVYETTPPLSDIPSNQELVEPVLKSEESERSNLGVPNKQFISPSPILSESRAFQAKCEDKNNIDGIINPPKRFLEVVNYNIPSQQKILVKNNIPQTKSNKVFYMYPKNNLNTNMGIENVDPMRRSTFIEKSTANNGNFYNIQKTERALQQPSKDMAGLTGGIRYAYNINSKVRDPAKGEGISHLSKNVGMNLMDFERVCYACSTASNPRCWLPDRKTTVKYCRKGDNACVTKTFGSGSTFILTRDCGKTCNDDDVLGLYPNYKTCSICHSDLCNGSHSINVSSSILALPTSLLIILVTIRATFCF